MVSVVRTVLPQIVRLHGGRQKSALCCLTQHFAVCCTAEEGKGWLGRSLGEVGSKGREGDPEVMIACAAVKYRTVSRKVVVLTVRSSI